MVCNQHLPDSNKHEKNPNVLGERPWRLSGSWENIVGRREGCRHSHAHMHADSHTYVHAYRRMACAHVHVCTHAHAHTRRHTRTQYLFVCLWVLDSVTFFLFGVLSPHSSRANYSRNGYRWCTVIRKPGSAWLKGTPAMDLGYMNVVLKWLWELVSPRIHASPPTLWSVLPTCWGSAWVCRKLGNAPVLQSGTGYWVLSG